MRAVALTSSSADQGRITDAEAVVGEITLDGTMFLVLAGTLTGIVGALAYAAVRRWFAPAGRWRGLLFGLFLAATLGFGVMTSAGDDFSRFGSPALNILMFEALFVLFGVLIAPSYDYVEDRLRQASAPVLWLALVPAVFCILGFMALPITSQDWRMFVLLLYVLVVPAVVAATGGALAQRLGPRVAWPPAVIGGALLAATIAGVFADA